MKGKDYSKLSDSELKTESYKNSNERKQMIYGILQGKGFNFKKFSEVNKEAQKSIKEEKRRKSFKTDNQIISEKEKAVKNYNASFNEYEKARKSKSSKKELNNLKAKFDSAGRTIRSYNDEIERRKGIQKINYVKGIFKGTSFFGGSGIWHFVNPKTYVPKEKFKSYGNVLEDDLAGLNFMHDVAKGKYTVKNFQKDVKEKLKTVFPEKKKNEVPKLASNKKEIAKKTQKTAQNKPKSR